MDNGEQQLEKGTKKGRGGRGDILRGLVLLATCRVHTQSR